MTANCLWVCVYQVSEEVVDEKIEKEGKEENDTSSGNGQTEAEKSISKVHAQVPLQFSPSASGVSKTIGILGDKLINQEQFLSYSYMSLCTWVASIIVVGWLNTKTVDSDSGISSRINPVLQFDLVLKTEVYLKNDCWINKKLCPFPSDDQYIVPVRTFIQNDLQRCY